MPPIIATLVWSTLLFNQPLLLIDILPLLTPLRSFILPAFLFLVSFLFRLVHSLGIVLSGRVDGHDFEGFAGGGIDELVFGPCGDDDDVGFLDVLSSRFLISNLPPLYCRRKQAGICCSQR